MPPALTQGVLMTWNPLFSPETVRVHVEAHRKSPPGDRKTWWGRLSLGASEEYTQRPAREAVELLSRNPAQRPVLVTDYIHLHALRVDLITREQPPEAVPPYYSLQADAKVSFWMRVRDIRSIHHEQAATLDFLRNNVRLEKDAAWGFDPYASMKHVFPRKIWAPSNQDLFDPHGAPKSGFYADAPDAIDRPVMEDAYRRLRKTWGTSTWEDLHPYSKECLASADILYRDDRLGFKHAKGVDPVPLFVQMARAVERELVGEILRPLYEARRMPTSMGRILSHAFSGLNPRLSLGSFELVLQQRLLDGWAGDYARARRTQSLLCGVDGWREWISELTGVRNDVLHAKERAFRQYVQSLASTLLDAEQGPPDRAWETVVTAKKQVRSILEAAERSIPTRLR